MVNLDVCFSKTDNAAVKSTGLLVQRLQCWIGLVQPGRVCCVIRPHDILFTCVYYPPFVVTLRSIHGKLRIFISIYLLATLLADFLLVWSLDALPIDAEAAVLGRFFLYVRLRNPVLLRHSSLFFGTCTFSDADVANFAGLPMATDWLLVLPLHFMGFTSRSLVMLHFFGRPNPLCLNFQFRDAQSSWQACLSFPEWFSRRSVDLASGVHAFIRFSWRRYGTKHALPCRLLSALHLQLCDDESADV